MSAFISHPAGQSSHWHLGPREGLGWRLRYDSSEVAFGITKCQSLVGLRLPEAFMGKNNHHNKLERPCQARCHTPVIPAFGRLKQEDCEFEVNLDRKILFCLLKKKRTDSLMGRAWTYSHPLPMATSCLGSCHVPLGIFPCKDEDVKTSSTKPSVTFQESP